jgi:hypothetical protein
VTATSSHASLRIQFYPAVGGPTIGIDAVDVHKALSQNGGFNNGTAPWSASGSANFAVHTGSSSYEGSGYAATNASASGDSIRENKTVSIASGDTYCGSAEVSTAGSGSGGSGQFVIWLLGGSSSESSTMSFSGLPGGGQWTPVQTCVTATTAHTSLRIQFYPTVGGPTINVDAVDVHSSFAQNGGFNNGTAPWSASGSANFAVSSGGYEGTKYAATNASAAGDSLRENKTLTIGSGDTFCGSAEVSTAGSGSGGGGQLVLWLTGGPGADENSSVTFSSLPGSGRWTWVHTCVTATSSHATLRVQVYPAVGGPTIDVDAVDVH